MDVATPRYIDLSHPLGPETPVSAGYPPVAIEILEAIEDPPSPTGVRALNSSRIASGLHCSTHMDAPYHFFPDGRRIDQIPLAQCAGPALRIKLTGKGPGSSIQARDLAAWEAGIRGVRKVVLNTGWHHRWGRPEYFVDFPVVAADAAQYLVTCGVQLLGIDTPSLDIPPFDAHVALLGSGAVIVENLANLDAIGRDEFELSALPLPIAGREASPVRAVVILP